MQNTITKTIKTTSNKNWVLYSLFCCLLFIFVFNIFKNISYPLLWNDEAETAVYSKRILEFGYPKVHDVKNTVCLMGPLEWGIRPEIDAYISSVWGQYYFAALGEFFAQHFDDIYTKTAILRIPFAIAGFCGILILMFYGMNLFHEDKKKAWIFGILFLLIECFSVSLILHLREVRYYSLSILWSASIIVLYLSFRFKNRMKYSLYFTLMFCFVFLLFNSFPPACFSSIISVGICMVYQIIFKKNFKKEIQLFLPFLCSFIFIIPLLIFHKTLQISSDLTFQFNVSFEKKIELLHQILTFLADHEFLWVILTAKILLLLIYPSFIKKIPALSPIKTCLRISHFLFLFVSVHLFLVLKIPFDFTYVRYYILCQPLLSFMLLLDVFSIQKSFSCSGITFSTKVFKTVATFLLLVSTALSLPHKIRTLKDHFYELFHQYKGVLDYGIPFIQSNFNKPESLIIATNYEECSYMYYLKSKVIIGCNNINLEEDLKIIPDIIIPRKQWKGNFPEIIEYFIKKANYSIYYFPVYDSYVNNYPQLGYSLEHMFKTRLTKNEKEMFVILVKE